MILGIISDIHEDVVSLKKALRLLEKYRCDDLICLGDITGFSVPFYAHLDTRNANECIKLVRENFSTVLASNHDLHAIKKLPEFKAGIEYPDNFYDYGVYERKQLIQDKIWHYEKSTLDPLLSDENIEYLKSLAELNVYDSGDNKILLSHFIYPDLSGAVARKSFHAEDLNHHVGFVQKKSCNISICGHAHIEGALIYNNGLRFVKFGKTIKVAEAKCIICPCIANGINENGLIIYNISTAEIKIISLHSGKFKMNYRTVSRDSKFLFDRT